MYKEIAKIGAGKIATVMGRFYAMDRDNRWDRVEKAYNALVFGEGVQETDPVQAVKNSYANGVTDEFMLPTVVEKDAKIAENEELSEKLSQNAVAVRENQSLEKIIEKWMEIIDG